MKRAKAKAVANLANSAGCKLTGPKISQEREPFVSGAMKMVTTNSKSKMPYIK